MSISAILHSGLVAQTVLLVLLSFSLLSWAIIILKYFSIKKAKNNSLEFLDVFWKLKNFDQVFEISKRYHNSPLAQIFLKGYHELQLLKKTGESEYHLAKLGEFGFESLEHTLRKASRTQMANLESLIPFLATAGATSPFIGLFGTVVGIMNSFAQIGLQGSASLATVAPGMAEALVATAAGLLVAIPAVIAYNYFSTQVRSLSIEMDTFARDFINIAKHNSVK